MNRVTKAIASLSVPFVLYGCELQTDIDIQASLEPFNEAQLTIAESVVPMIRNSAVTSSASVDFSVTTDCSVATDANGLSPAQGTLVLDTETYTITDSLCSATNSFQSFVGDPGAFASGTLYRAVGTNDPAPVAIVSATLIDDTLPLDPSGSLEPAAGANLLYVIPFPQPDGDPNAPRNLAPLVAGVLNLTEEEIPNDPAPAAARPTIVQAQQDLDTLLADTEGQIQHILQKASRVLGFATADYFWESDTTLNNRYGQFMFRYVAFAINKIEIVADHTTDGNLMAGLDNITSTLLDTMNALAANRIAQAVAAGADDYLIFRANQALDNAGIRRQQDNLRRATLLYGKAWRIANRSLR